MNIFFTASKYESVSLTNQNYNRAVEVFQREIVYLSVIGTVFQTFELLQSLSNYSPFIWIDGDNWLYDDASIIFEQQPPVIMLTRNEYGIVYGHGGIKYCDGKVSLPQDYQTIDCSKHARYKAIDIIGSYHHLGDDWRKIRTIWVEMCKLALRGSIGEHYLQLWKIARPDIWNNVHSFLCESTNIQDVKRIINSRTEFRKYYDTKLCRYLQE